MSLRAIKKDCSEEVTYKLSPEAEKRYEHWPHIYPLCFLPKDGDTVLPSLFPVASVFILLAPLTTWNVVPNNRPSNSKTWGQVLFTKVLWTLLLE